MVKVGIIGTGWGVNVQLPIFNSIEGMEVTAVYSRSQDKADATAKKFGIQHAFDSVEALCNCVDVDVVSVVSPTHFHQEHALAALRAGKHVLCDKPLAVDAAGAALMAAEAAARPNQLALVDHEIRFLPFVQKAAALVQSGALGELYHVDVLTMLQFGHFGRSHGWWNERESGGGVLGAVGVHMVDPLLLLL
jgi:predicted dehydrogenase